MKPYEPKNRDKTKAKKKGGGGQRAIKNQIKKREDNETLCQKSKKGRIFF
jgi:hypothetical protein